jgi:acetate kinase
VILVLNVGSSSLKYGLADLAPHGPVDTVSRRGQVTRIGEPGGPASDHRSALDQALAELSIDPATVRAVGHRVVHGGARFTRPTLVDEEVLAALRQLVPLAPLHNPPAIEGIEAARARLPGTPQVAVFDTAFHADLPPAAATYAIDTGIAQSYGIKRYGFHGISHAYVARRTARLLGRPWTDLNIIVLHLGNGASATAVQSGRSVETSMGFTPLEGLVMGTRSGDLDPAVVTFLQRDAGMPVAEVDDLLTHRSGLLGLAGAGDVRSVLAAREAGDERAALAVDVYCHRIRKYVGAYHAVLGHLDAITFTAGVGEHAPAIRAESLAGLQAWGIAVDPIRNDAPGDSARTISSPDARVAVCVVPTDEETAIAEGVASLLADDGDATVGQDDGHPGGPGQHDREE